MIRCWVAAHMCVLSHLRTCDVRAEVRAERVLNCACVVGAYGHIFDVRLCDLQSHFLSWMICGQTIYILWNLCWKEFRSTEMVFPHIIQNYFSTQLCHGVTMYKTMFILSKMTSAFFWPFLNYLPNISYNFYLKRPIFGDFF